LEQIAGSETGGLKVRFCHGAAEQEWRNPRIVNSRKWRLGSYDLSPAGDLFRVDLRFWWGGNSRTVSFGWEKEDHFQHVEATTTFG
jgi:hypothetical protein